jgi:hypothetical protein
VRVEVPLLVTEVGLNVAVTSEGRPETLRFTAPVNPLMAEIVTTSEPLELRFTVIAGGAEMVKSEALAITRVAVAVCTSGPVLPVTVNM